MKRIEKALALLLALLLTPCLALAQEADAYGLLDLPERSEETSVSIPFYGEAGVGYTLHQKYRGIWLEPQTMELAGTEGAFAVELRPGQNGFLLREAGQPREVAGPEGFSIFCGPMEAPAPAPTDYGFLETPPERTAETQAAIVFFGAEGVRYTLFHKHGNSWLQPMTVELAGITGEFDVSLLPGENAFVLREASLPLEVANPLLFTIQCDAVAEEPEEEEQGESARPDEETFQWGPGADETEEEAPAAEEGTLPEAPAAEEGTLPEAPAAEEGTLPEEPKAEEGTLPEAPAAEEAAGEASEPPEEASEPPEEASEPPEEAPAEEPVPEGAEEPAEEAEETEPALEEEPVLGEEEPEVEAGVARTLVLWITGDDVTALQQGLTGLGYSLGKADGVYGPRTRRAVTRFQKEYGLKADGIVGTDTRAKLAEQGVVLPLYFASSDKMPDGFERILRLGVGGMDVRALQEALIARGYLAGKPDHIYGPKTRAAVRAFQRDNGLKADGIAGPKTLQLLFPEGEPDR